MAQPEILFAVPFANEGDKNTIPETSTETGVATLTEGFPPITSVPLASGGVAPTRADFNGILNMLSQYAVWQQIGGLWAYDSTMDYTPPCMVVYNDALYWCLQANGASSTVVTPGDDSTYWKELVNTGGNALNDDYVTLSTTQTISGSKTFSKNTTLKTSSGTNIYLTTTATNADGDGTFEGYIGVKSGKYFGLYSTTLSKWLLYIDASGNIHLGSSTIGGAKKPIYLSSGTPTAFSDTVGSGTKPVYLSSGTITASSSTVGSGTKPVYLSSGTITASSSTVGSGTKPVYLSSGTITASSSTVGSATEPVYMSSGTITKCSVYPVTAVSKASTGGYFSLSNGIIVNWGTTTVTSNATVTATFKKAFTTTYYAVLTNPQTKRTNSTSDMNFLTYVTSKSTANFSFNFYDSDDNSWAQGTVGWIAIGY